jgi:hypothetical protein
MEISKVGKKWRRKFMKRKREREILNNKMHTQHVAMHLFTNGEKLHFTFLDGGGFSLIWLAILDENEEGLIHCECS